MICKALNNRNDSKGYAGLS